MVCEASDRIERDDDDDEEQAADLVPHVACSLQYDDRGGSQSEGVRTFHSIPYAAEFCPDPDPTCAYRFAVVAGTYLTLYKCIEEGRVVPLQVYKDSNVREGWRDGGMDGWMDGWMVIK